MSFTNHHSTSSLIAMMSFTNHHSTSSLTAMIDRSASSLWRDKFHCQHSRVSLTVMISFTVIVQPLSLPSFNIITHSCDIFDGHHSASSLTAVALSLSSFNFITHSHGTFIAIVQLHHSQQWYLSRSLFNFVTNSHDPRWSFSNIRSGHVQSHLQLSKLYGFTWVQKDKFSGIAFCLHLQNLNSALSTRFCNGFRCIARECPLSVTVCRDQIPIPN